MSKYEIPYFTACIQAFGRRFSMTRQAAFRYLHEHKGLAFLIEFFDVEHLQSMDETIDDLLIVCQKNGGKLAWHWVYNSALMPALQDEENELYVQSPAYLYEMMNDQLIQYNVEHQLLW